MPKSRPGRVAILLTATAATALTACSSGGGARSSTPPVIFTPAARPTSSPPVAAPTSSTPSTTSRATPTQTLARSTTPPPRITTSTAAAPTSTAPTSVGKGRVVVINPGHNGDNASHSSEINKQVPAGYGAYKACDTTGTETNAGYPEHAFNWDVSLRIRSILRAHGVRVVFTRPNDHGVGPCVDARTETGNHPDVAAVVSIHADGATSSGHGFHVNQDSRTPDGATKAVAHQSDLLGEAIHATLEQSSGLVPSTYIGENGYFYRTDLAGLDLATRPATFLELGNMRNSGDAALQTSASGRQRIAAAVAAGILNFLSR